MGWAIRFIFILFNVWDVVAIRIVPNIIKILKDYLSQVEKH